MPNKTRTGKGDSNLAAVNAYLKKNEARFVRELSEYLEIPSVSAQREHRPDIRRCAAWIAKHCRSIGLATKIYETPGNPIVVARTPPVKGKGRLHYLVYGHYDVQPTDPLGLWVSAPFKPAIRGGRIYARGSSDNKGQHLAHLNAVEAYLKTGTELPCDLTFVLEGEEEVGSARLTEFLLKNRKKFRCDGVVVSDGSMPSLAKPALTYGLRGNVAVEVIVRGPSRDLHSGSFGGAVDNPATVLCRMIAALHDRDGRIAVPGFYRGVVPLSKAERRRLAQDPWTPKALAKFVGVPQLKGEKGYTPEEQRTSRPTLEVNGLTSGYQGEGGKTIVPAWARAKLTCRLVPDQDPSRIAGLVKAHLKRICPPTVRVEFSKGHHGGPAYLIPVTEPSAKAALRALEKAYCHPASMVREGGSIPIVSLFKSALGAETLLLGLGLPSDNTHSPNEAMSLAGYRLGARLGAFLWPELAR